MSSTHNHWEKTGNSWSIYVKNCSCNSFTPNIRSFITNHNLKTEIRNRVFGTKPFTFPEEIKTDLENLLVDLGIYPKAFDPVVDLIETIGKMDIDDKPSAHPDAVSGIYLIKQQKIADELHHKNIQKSLSYYSYN